MTIDVNDEAYLYELKTYMNAYFPQNRMESQESEKQLKVVILNDTFQLLYSVKGKVYERVSKPIDWKKNEIADERRQIMEKKREIKRMLFDLMDQVHDIRLPWGILTGIRPTKVVFSYMNKHGEDLTGLAEHLWEVYRVAPDKIALMTAVALKEKKILDTNTDTEMSLYIGIPYCPSKCAYCSFTSFPILKGQDTKAYIHALNKEIQILKDPHIHNRQIRSLYFGGGTPTSLSADELELLFKALEAVIDLSRIPEITVEAGRPDTITREKLEVLKKYGVNRLSINPQTMNDESLLRIGRRHSVADVYAAYHLARDVGFDNINMDLIVGLPSETKEDVMRTMAAISLLEPEHVTMHTMAIKKGSLIKTQSGLDALSWATEIEAMIRIVSEGVAQMGLEPYYLYRQKNILGNYENVGYARPGRECIYNIEIMEEREDILAFGAGADTKLVCRETGKITRIENVSDVGHYVKRIDEMMQRKAVLLK